MFLPYMGVAAILVMIRPGLFIITLVPPSYRCFISNLTLIGQAVSEEILKIFEIVDGQTLDHGHPIS